MNLVMPRRLSGTCGLLCVFAALSLFTASAAFPADSTMFVTGYYANHSIHYYPPELVDYDALTHILHFSADVIDTPPYVNILASSGATHEWEYAGTGRNITRALIDSAHAHGVKVSLSIANVAFYGGNNATMSFVVSDSVRCQTFVDNVLNYCTSVGYDGVDINWEWPNWGDREGYTRMMRMFRRGMDAWPERGTISHTIYARQHNNPGSYGAYDIPLLNQYVDQHNVECYGLGFQQTNQRFGYTFALNPAIATIEAPGGYYDAISMTDPKHNTDYGYNTGPAGAVLQGWDRKKVGVGFGFLYYHSASSEPLLIGGSNTGSWQNYYRFNYGDIIGTGNGQFGAYPRLWNDETKSPYKKWESGGVYHFVSYEDSMSLAVKSRSVIDSGYGGIMIYELATGYITNHSGYDWAVPGYTGVRDPLLKAIKIATEGYAEPQPPPPPPPPPDLPKIKGDLYFDQNQDGVRQSWEPGIAGWRVYLDGPEDGDMLTDSAGEFSFDAIELGSYTVSIESKPGWTQMNPDSPPYYLESVDSTLYTAVVEFGVYSATAYGVGVDRYWNIIAVPVTTQTLHGPTLYPLALTSFFGFSGEYYTASTLDYGTAYWVKFPAAHTAWLQGTVRLADTITVIPGWNFLGALSYAVPTSEIVTSPPGILSNYVFGYDGSSYIASVLEPGRGYWILAHQAGTVQIAADPAIAPVAGGPSGGWRIAAGGGSSPGSADRLDGAGGLDRIELTDAAGGRQLLYYRTGSPGGENGGAGGSVSAPPGPPGDSFRARFRGEAGSAAQQVSPADESVVTVLRPDGRRETVVSVEGASLPITMSWKAQPGSTGVAISGNGGFRQLLEGEGSIEVTAADLIPGSGPAGGDESRRELRLVSGGTPADAVPTDFSVAQNYPNPFNGTTVVSFSLPEDGSAVVEVFDMLGERVLEVGRRDYGAGTHYVSIDADPLPSGVYFYRMTASSADRTWRSGTMKLILLK